MIIRRTRAAASRWSPRCWTRKSAASSLPRAPRPKTLPRLLAVDNEVVLPVGKVIKVEVTSTDVIHGFNMPAFGVKVNAIPGRNNEVWFKVDKEGLYYGQCTQICGDQHSEMPLAFHIVSPERYAEWLEEAKAKFASPQHACARHRPTRIHSSTIESQGVAAFLSSAGPAGAGRRHHDAAHRSQLRHDLLRPGGRRPDPLPASLLVFRSPRSLHHDPAGLRHRQPGHLDLLEEADLRLSRHGLCDGRDRRDRLRGLGPPHVHSRAFARHAAVFHRGHHGDRRTHGRENLLLDRHDVGAARSASPHPCFGRSASFSFSRSGA